MILLYWNLKWYLNFYAQFQKYLENKLKYEMLLILGILVRKSNRVSAMVPAYHWFAFRICLQVFVQLK